MKQEEIYENLKGREAELEDERQRRIRNRDERLLNEYIDTYPEIESWRTGGGY